MEHPAEEQSTESVQADESKKAKAVKGQTAESYTLCLLHRQMEGESQRERR